VNVGHEDRVGRAAKGGGVRGELHDVNELAANPVHHSERRVQEDDERCNKGQRHRSLDACGHRHEDERGD
jgi:hypothetical protein